MGKAQEKFQRGGITRYPKEKEHSGKKQQYKQILEAKTTFFIDPNSDCSKPGGPEMTCTFPIPSSQLFLKGKYILAIIFPSTQMLFGALCAEKYVSSYLLFHCN